MWWLTGSEITRGTMLSGWTHDNWVCGVASGYEETGISNQYITIPVSEYDTLKSNHEKSNNKDRVNKIISYYYKKWK